MKIHQRFPPGAFQRNSVCLFATETAERQDSGFLKQVSCCNSQDLSCRWSKIFFLHHNMLKENDYDMQNTALELGLIRGVRTLIHNCWTQALHAFVPLPHKQMEFLPHLIHHRSHLTKLTQGKNWHIYPNFLEANLQYFRLSTVRDDKNNKNCPSVFLNLGLKCC